MQHAFRLKGNTNRLAVAIAVAIAVAAAVAVSVSVRLLLFLFNPRRGICFHFSSLFYAFQLQCTFSIVSCLYTRVCVGGCVCVCN